jgi:aminoglycoside phosphotransferase (APT) family kinase protein
VTRAVVGDPNLLADLRQRAGRAAVPWARDAVIMDIAPLTGGASSLTFVAELSGVPAGYERVVLKVAPPGLAPMRNRDVLRQGRLMRALAGAPGVRLPEVLFSDAGNPPDVPPFLAMSLVPGECVEPILTPRGSLPASQVRARALDAVRMLAELHRVDPRTTELANEPVVAITAEVDRWTRAFTTVPDDLRAGYEEVAALLRTTAPPALSPVITHGDYRLGNTLCEGHATTAIIDWEIWSVGDPRIDVTWLTFFTDEARHPAAVSDEPTGQPTKAELVTAYEERRGERLPDLAWFEGLTKYKEAAATALLIKRWRRAGPLSPDGATLASALPVLLREATELSRG